MNSIDYVKCSYTMRYYISILISFSLISGCSSSKPQVILGCGNALMDCRTMPNFTDSVKVVIPYDTVYLWFSQSFTSYNFSFKFQNSRSLLDTMMLKACIHGEGMAFDSLESKKNIFWSHDTLFVYLKYFTGKSTLNSDKSYSSNIGQEFFQMESAIIDIPMNKVIRIVDNIWKSKK